jgi:excisionase family DNA binding protein
VGCSLDLEGNPVVTTTQPAEDVMADFDPLLSTQKVARLFDVKPETVRDWIEQGKIEGTKINGQWRIKKSEVMRFGKQRHGS